MLLRNGEPINLNHKDLDETEQWVKDEIQSIAQSNKPYVIKTKMRLRPLLDDQGFTHIDQRNKAIPTETTFKNPTTNLNENWQYLENGNQYKRMPGGDVKVTKTPSLVVSTAGTVRGRVLHSSKDAEVIFFLTKISASAVNGKIYLEDKEKEAKVRNRQRSLEIQAKNIIYNEQSPVSLEATGDESLMRQLATLWGVEGADSITYSEVKFMLEQRLDTSQANLIKTNRGYNEFINDAHRIGDYEKRSTVTLAIQKGILLFEDNLWYLRTKEGGLQMLLSILPEQVAERESIITNHLTKKENDRWIEIIDDMLTNPDAGKVLEQDPIEKWNKKKLMDYCKSELKYPHKVVFSKKVPELRDIVKDKLVYQE
jgi:hypothetical protein